MSLVCLWVGREKTSVASAVFLPSLCRIYTTLEDEMDQARFTGVVNELTLAGYKKGEYLVYRR